MLKSWEFSQKYPLKLWLPFILIFFVFIISLTYVNRMPLYIIKMIDYSILLILFLIFCVVLIFLFIYLKKIRMLKFSIVAGLLLMTFFMLYKYLL